ncbi:MAG: peptidylprolyl isomerase [Planctomycetota bacterium]
MRLFQSHRTTLVAAFVALVAQGTSAQLVPDREFYGVNRSIPMSVSLPEGGEAASIEIALFAPESDTPLESASAELGGVDLSTLFPILWTRSVPSLLYAQLVADGEPVGSAVVLQPMLTVRRARANGRTINWPGAGPSVYSGIRAYPEVHLVFETTQGEVEFSLRPDHAPNTCTEITSLVEKGFYTDIQMHRIMPGFVVQFGDPTGKGSGGPGFQFDLEPSTLPHDFGVLSMARTNDPDTNGSQLFICLTRQRTASLDGSYTAFGTAIRGADVIEALGRTELSDQRTGAPIEPPVVTSAHTVPAPPYPNRPAPATRPAPEPSSR